MDLASKIRQFLQAGANNIGNAVSGAAGAVGNELKALPSQVGNFGQTLTKAAQPSLNVFNNFSQPSIGPVAFGPAPQVPDINLPQVPQNIQNTPVVGPVTNFGRNLIQGAVNSFPHYIQGTNKLNEIVRNATQGVTPNPVDVISNVAKTTELPLLLAGGAGEKTAADTLFQAPSFKNALIQGFKNIPQTAAITGGFGLAGGLEQPAQNVQQQIGQGVQSGVIGAATGVPLAFAGPVGGALVGKAADLYKNYKFDNMQNILSTMTPKEATTGKVANVADAVQVLKNPAIRDGIMGSVNSVRDGTADASVHNTLNRFFNNLLPEFNTTSIEDKAHIADNLLSVANDNSFTPTNIHPLLQPTFDYANGMAGQEGRIGARSYQGDVEANTNKVISTKESRAVQDSINQRLDTIRQSASTPQAWTDGINGLVADVSSNANGDKVVLSGLRTALNKTLASFAGDNGGHILDLKVLSEMRSDPEMGAIINNLEDHITNIDKQLSQPRTAMPITPPEIQPKPIEAPVAKPVEVAPGIPYKNAAGDELPFNETPPVSPKLADLKLTENPAVPRTEPLDKLPFDNGEVGPGKGTPGIASVDPKAVAEQVRLARAGTMGALNFRAQTLAEQMDRVLKTPEDNLNIRLAMESPAKLDEYADQSSNPQAFKQVAKLYSNFTDYVAKGINDTKDTGTKMNTIQDYFTHIWDLSTPEAQQKFEDLMAANAKNFESGFNKARVVATIQEGLDKGLTLKNKLASQDVVQYSRSMGTQIGAQAFNQKLNELRPGGTQPIGTPTYNYKGQLFKQSNVPGNEGTVIDPEIQKEMGFYNKSALAETPIVAGKDITIAGKTLHIPGAEELNQLLKKSQLALGGFHALNTTLRQIVNDPRVVPSAIRSTFDAGYRNQIAQKAIEDGVIDYGTKHGVTFSQSGDVLPQGGSLLDTLKSKNPITKFNNSLFGGMINTYKINLVRGMMDKFPDTTDPIQEKQAQAFGAQINNLMGGMNYEQMGRNKSVQQAFRLIGLAPDFNEGIIKQVLTAADPRGYMSSTSRPAALFALKNVVGQVALWATISELGRKLTTGNFSPDFQSFVANSILKPNVPLPDNAAFNNPKTGKTQTANLPASELNVMAGALTDPEHFLQARGSAVVSAAGSLLSGKDYYGNPLVNAWDKTPDTLANRALAIIPNKLPIPVQQALKLSTGAQTPGVTALNIAGLRVGNNPNDPKTIATNNYFKALNTASASLNPNDQKTFLGLLHPTTKDPNGNPVVDKNYYTTPDKYETLLSNPKLLAAEQTFQQSQPSHDPLWDLTPTQQRAYMQAEIISKNNPTRGFSTGDKTVSTLYSTIPQTFFNQRASYFASLPQSTQNSVSTATAQAPQAPKDVSNFWTQYSTLPYGTGARSKMLQTPEGQKALAFTQTEQTFTNQQRADLGLPLLAAGGSSSSGGSSYSKYKPYPLVHFDTKGMNMRGTKLAFTKNKVNFGTKGKSFSTKSAAKPVSLKLPNLKKSSNSGLAYNAPVRFHARV